MASVRSAILWFFLCASLAPSAAHAQLAQPSPLPSELAAAAKSELAETRSVLLAQMNALRAEIAAHDQRCGSVADTDAAMVASCEQSRSNLLQEIDAYQSALAAYEHSLHAQETDRAGPAAKFCAAKLKVAADERAIQQMNFANDASSFEMFAAASATQKAQLQKKVIDALLDQGFEATTMAATSAQSLNPYSVNTTIDKLRANMPKGLDADALFAGLRKVAATKGKPGMAAAYTDFVQLIQSAKEGYDAGEDMAEDRRNAGLRLLLGLLKVAQDAPELGLIATSADFGESLGYLGYISAQVNGLGEDADAKLVRLNSRIDRLKRDVGALSAAKQDAARIRGKLGEPDCGA